jgi:hypothetical protein
MKEPGYSTEPGNKERGLGVDRPVGESRGVIGDHDSGNRMPMSARKATDKKKIEKVVQKRFPFDLVSKHGIMILLFLGMAGQLARTEPIRRPLAMER